jgi:putative FmdB family regulatory protein
MPIYEYRCNDCGEHFEKWLRSLSAKPDICCPRCGSPRVDKAVSLFGSSSSTGGLTADSSCAPTGG